MNNQFKRQNMKTKPKAVEKDSLKRKRVQFSFIAPDSKEVNLVGDFNKWNPKAHPLRKGEDGNWTKILYVQPGRYEYRFLVDGRWESDPDNHNFTPNSFGTYNNVMNIPEA
jgi:1,4-alpha-glucan branching enzyme